MTKVTEEGAKLLEQLNTSDLILKAGDEVKLLNQVDSPLLLGLGVAASQDLLLVYSGSTFICRVPKHLTHLYFED